MGLGSRTAQARGLVDGVRKSLEDRARAGASPDARDRALYDLLAAVELLAEEIEERLGPSAPEREWSSSPIVDAAEGRAPAPAGTARCAVIHRDEDARCELAAGHGGWHAAHVDLGTLEWAPE